MTFLGGMGIRAKLGLLMCLAALGILASILAATNLLHRRMIEDRIDKLRAVITVSQGLAQLLQEQVDAHLLSPAQAFATFRADIHHIRFGGATDYLIVYGADGTVLMHGGDPGREGKPTTARDEHGRSSVDLAREVLRTAPGGAIWYRVSKPGQSVPQMKVTYVAEFRPWQMVFMAGAWINDINEEFVAALLRLGEVGAGVLVFSALAAWLVNRDIAGSLGGLKRAMEHLASGEVATPIPGVGRRDEVGAMAAAVLVFRDNMQQTALLRAEQEEERRRVAAGNREMLLRMADGFEAQVGQLVGTLSSNSASLEAAARSMEAVAQQSTGEAATVAQAAEAARSGLGAVAAAAEQLTVSFGEIGRQIAHSAQTIDAAVEGARRTDALVQALAANADRIGAVVGMIADIATKTNLLALNATIEAARAGEAGRGFTVVASEVKTLASQTSAATGEIGRQVADIQAATRQAVEAVAGIAAGIREMSGVAATIASAVTQQTAATSEIVRTLNHTFEAARLVTVSSGRVRETAGAADMAAGQVSAASSEVSQHTRQLRAQVDEFVARIRAA